MPLKTEYKSTPKLLSRRTDSDANTSTTCLDGANEEMTLAERQRKTQLDREEKQRKYTEAREKLFGPSSLETPSVGIASTTFTKPSKGKSRNSYVKGEYIASSAEVSPSRTTNRIKELYDPNEGNKRGELRPQIFARDENITVPIRMPNGPDVSMNGGIGFERKLKNNRG